MTDLFAQYLPHAAFIGACVALLLIIKLNDRVQRIEEVLKTYRGRIDDGQER